MDAARKHQPMQVAVAAIDSGTSTYGEFADPGQHVADDRNPFGALPNLPLNGSVSDEPHSDALYTHNRLQQEQHEQQLSQGVYCHRSSPTLLCSSSSMAAIGGEPLSASQLHASQQLAAAAVAAQQHEQAASSGSDTKPELSALAALHGSSSAHDYQPAPSVAAITAYSEHAAKMFAADYYMEAQKAFGGAAAAGYYQPFYPSGGSSSAVQMPSSYYEAATRAALRSTHSGAAEQQESNDSPLPHLHSQLHQQQQQHLYSGLGVNAYLPPTATPPAYYGYGSGAVAAAAAAAAAAASYPTGNGATVAPDPYALSYYAQTPAHGYTSAYQQQLALAAAAAQVAPGVPSTVSGPGSMATIQHFDSFAAAANALSCATAAAGKPPKEARKGKGKKRKAPANNTPTASTSAAGVAGAGVSPECRYERVFIWDLDEAALGAHALVGGPASLADKCRQALDTLVYHVCATHFDIADMEECDQVNVEDIAAEEPFGPDANSCTYAESTSDVQAQLLVSTSATDSQQQQQQPLQQQQHRAMDAAAAAAAAAAVASGSGCSTGADWLQRLSAKYGHLRRVYSLLQDRPACELAGKLVSSEHFEQTMCDVAALTRGRAQCAASCMQLIAHRQRYANVVITSSSVAVGAAQCLLFGLAGGVPLEHIYSAARIGRDAAVDRVVARFGTSSTTYVMLSTRPIRQKHVPRWPVYGHEDLNTLLSCLKMDHL